MRPDRSIPGSRATTLLLLLSLVGGCGWFAGSSDTVPSDATSDTDTDLPSEDPADDLPKCRPADAVETRGEIPFTVGATTDSGWKITDVDAENFEFIRVAYAKDGAATELEIAYNVEPPGDWSTEDYRLMPSPELDEQPPQELLEEVMGQIRAWQTTQTEPFVMKKEGVIDPYDGLPPCGPDGKPL